MEQINKMNYIARLQHHFQPLQLQRTGIVAKQSELNIKDAVSKLQSMDNPVLILINSNLTSLSTDIVTEEEKDQGKDNYNKFLSNEKNDAVINECINLTNIEGIHSWICPYSKVSELSAAFLLDNISNTKIELPDDFLTNEDLFDTLKIEIQGVDKISKIKMDLKTAWKSIVDSLPKKIEPEPEPKPKQEEKKSEDKVEVVKDKKDIGKEAKEEDDIEDIEIVPDDLEIEDASTINIGVLRSLRNPYIFMLDPRKKYADYRNFLGPDEEGETPKASKILPKAIKFLVSKKVKAEGAPVIIYFLDERLVGELRKELKRTTRPHYYLAPFDKKLFDTEEPFSGFTFGDKPLDPLLEDELNNIWVNMTSEVSGNPIPAIQANTSVPLNFFRLLNKKQRPVQFYMGNYPEGAGSSGVIYVLASEDESENFIKNIRHYKLPSLFYERMSANSDIDDRFKSIDPEELKVANLLILTAQDTFKPKEQVKLNEEMMSLLPDNIQKAYGEVIKLKQEDKPTPDKKQKLEQAQKVIEDFSPKVTQLYLLHAFAREKLGNRMKHVGTFISGGSPVIGTLVVNFNANMTVCFLWGSLNQHVTVDTKEMLKQLPFVKAAITSYL